MIAYLKGTVLAKTDDALILENNEIGYEVAVPVTLWRKIDVGTPLSLYTHEYLREDSRELYGFVTLGDLKFFRKLISISGVGPKSALNILSLGTVGELQTAIAQGNISYLTAIPGIGQKTAQKIVIELKGRLELDGESGDQESLEALQSLGYSQAQARDALRRVSPDVSDVGDRVRAALKLLGQKAQ